MPRSFDLLAESPATVEQIHSTFRDENYWLARLAAFGGIGTLEGRRDRGPATLYSHRRKTGCA
jgi:hypothetical protein